MNVSASGQGRTLLTVTTAQPAKTQGLSPYKVREAVQNAAEEQRESRAIQVAEGEIGGRVDTYA